MAGLFDRVSRRISGGMDRLGMFFNDPKLLENIMVEQIDPNAPVIPALKRWTAATIGGPGDIVELVEDVADVDIPINLTTTESVAQRIGAPTGAQHSAIDWLALDPVGMLTKGVKGVRQIVAGESARSADLDALKKAQELEKKGVSRDLIVRDTGWWRDGDTGQWKFEISDQLAELTPTGERFFDEDVTDVAVEHMLHHPRLERNYPRVMETSVVPARKGIEGSYQHPSGGQEAKITLQKTTAVDPWGNPFGTPAKKRARSTMLHELQHAVQDAENFAMGGSPAIAPHALGAAIDTIKEKNRFTLAEHALRQKHNADWMSYISANNLDYMTDLLHVSAPRQVFGNNLWYEHGDKVREILGPPPRYGERTTYAKKAGELMARLEFEKRFSPRAADSVMLYDRAKPIYSFNEFYDFAKTNRDWIKRQSRNAKARYDRSSNRIKKSDFPKKEARLNKAYQLEAVRKSKQREWFNRDPLDSSPWDYDLYRKLAGEAEARATEKRQALSAAERRNRPFWQDLDVPETEMIPITMDEMRRWLDKQRR